MQLPVGICAGLRASIVSIVDPAFSGSLIIASVQGLALTNVILRPLDKVVWVSARWEWVHVERVSMLYGSM